MQRPAQPPASPWETDLLAELIERKHEVLGQLCAHTRRQEAVIQGGEMNSLLALLASKQTLLNELQQLERALDPFRQQDPESRRWRSLAARARCRELSEQCTVLLREIMQGEKRGAGDLAHRRDAVAAQLQGLHCAADASQAYALAPELTLRTLDLTSDS